MVTENPPSGPFVNEGLMGNNGKYPIKKKKWIFPLTIHLARGFSSQVWILEARLWAKNVYMIQATYARQGSNMIWVENVRFLPVSTDIMLLFPTGKLVILGGLTHTHPGLQLLLLGQLSLAWRNLQAQGRKLVIWWWQKGLDISKVVQIGMYFKQL